jgi:hypothetical protein
MKLNKNQPINYELKDLNEFGDSVRGNKFKYLIAP